MGRVVTSSTYGRPVHSYKEFIVTTSTRRTHILQKSINKIDSIIDDLHLMPVQFSKGSIFQRLITDLDGARITARAIISLEEYPNGYKE